MAKNEINAAIIQYKYGILLKDNPKGNTYMVYFKGKPLIVQNTHVDITCNQPISKQQLFDMFDGTNKIIGIIGDFTDDKPTNKDNKE